MKTKFTRRQLGLTILFASAAMAFGAMPALSAGIGGIER